MVIIISEYGISIKFFDFKFYVYRTLLPKNMRYHFPFNSIKIMSVFFNLEGPSKDHNILCLDQSEVHKTDLRRNSPSPVIESRKNVWVQRKFLFHVLIFPYLWLPEKFWCKPQNNQVAPKPPNFQNDGIFICGVKIQMPTTYTTLERKFIRIIIVLRTRVQK